MQRINKAEYKFGAPLLSGFSTNTVIKSILAGHTPGRLYGDDPIKPQVVFAQFRHRAFIAGDPTKLEGDEFLHFIDSTVSENCRMWEVPLFRLAFDPQLWKNFLEQNLASRQPIEAAYRCYQYCISNERAGTNPPEGFALKKLSADLIATDFENKEELLDEMCSERESVEAFLEKSFGILAFHGQTLAGWCLSEYNFADQCEIGIATLPKFQKQGIAKAMTYTFINQAANEGIKRILWHCYQSNEASWRTALSVGFDLVKEVPVLLVYIDPSLNAAVHGNLCFERAEFQKALVWYQKALHESEPQSWMAWNGACAAAHCDEIDLAFDLLHRAMDLGFTDLDYLVKSDHMAPLKENSRWGEIITRMNHLIHA